MFVARTSACWSCLLILSVLQPGGEPLLSLHHFGGEGGPVIAASRAVQVAVHAGPSTRYKLLASIPLARNEVIEWDEPRTSIYRFGEAEVGADTLETEAEIVRFRGGRITSLGVETVRFTAGQTLEVLCYQAEGYYYVRDGNRTMAVFLENLRLVREPETETWVRVSAGDGLKGWIQVDGEVVRVVRRLF